MFNNREEVLQIAKFGLNQIRGFCRSFQTKIKRKQKKKRGKELEKGKGPAATLWPGYQNDPWPITSLPRNSIVFHLLPSLTPGPHLSSIPNRPNPT
jgi:hypothetical protein